MLVVMGAIFFLSHQPGSRLALSLFSFQDKVAHAGIYALLAATVLWAFAYRWQKIFGAVAICIFTVSICLVYGALDEFHQSFIAGRDSSVFDLMADLFGGVICCLIYAVWYRREGRKRRGSGHNALPLLSHF